MSQNVLVVLPLTEHQRAEFASALPDAHFTFMANKDVTPADVADADVILGNVNPDYIKASPRLKWIHLGSAGADNYVVPGVLDPATLLTSSVGAYGQAVSEHVFAQVLAVQKKLELYRDDQRAHSWTDEGKVSSLHGATVLVLGAGDIGTAFARLCAAFGAHVIGARRHPLETGEPYERIVSLDEARALLPQADVVVSFLPSTPQTQSFADADFFAAMKEGAVFANGGRGDFVDENALIAALESGHLAGAALDVMRTEPLPDDSPLWDVPNLLITPHVAGFFHLPANLDATVDLTLSNLRTYAAGDTLPRLIAH